ncbi:MAG TPA: response regulator [Thermoanaerobaculia bacterium]|nr:response regulator [Thermoanaerobaculia bacterium]
MTVPRADILVVEDDEPVRALLIEYLTEHSDFVVDGARDGVDALHQVCTHRYRVVVLDVMMPYMTGIDFLDSLEAMVSDPSIKTMDELPAVVIITAAPPEQIPSAVIEQRFPSMVRCVFRKPVDPQGLAECVERLLR